MTRGAKPGLQIRSGYLGLLDQIMRCPGRDQVIRRADIVQQRGDLERMIDVLRAARYCPPCISSAYATASRVTGSR